VPQVGVALASGIAIAGQHDLASFDGWLFHIAGGMLRREHYRPRQTL
jgi:hypothetical protein